MQQPGRKGFPLVVITILEAIFVLLIARIAAEAFRSLTIPGRWEAGHQLNFSFGWILLLMAYGTLTIRRVPSGSVGLDAKRWKTEFQQVASVLATKLHIHTRWIFPMIVMYLIACFGIGMLHYSPTDLGKLFAWQLTATAIGEEIFFRGYVLGIVDRADRMNSKERSVTLGMIVSSLLFGGLHLFNNFQFFGDKHDLAYLIAIQTTITGLLFAVIRVKSGSLVPGIFLHALLNITSFTVLPGFTAWIIHN